MESEDDPIFNELISDHIMFKWVPTKLTPIGTSQLKEAATYSFTIDSVIPRNAVEVLIFATVRSGYTETQRTGPVYLTIFTQIGSVQYKKYIYLETYNQLAYSTNSENMWFPMPQNGSIFLDVPIAFQGKVEARLFTAGYRVYK